MFYNPGIMDLDINDVKRIYFLTRTSLSEKRIINLGKYISGMDMLVDRIIKIHSIDLEKDWALFDFNYINNNTFFASKREIIDEKNIFQGTYTHACRTGKKYLIQIIGKYGYCKRCDTQFFPRIWWDHPLRNSYDYNEIKYGLNIQKKNIELDKDYEIKLLKLKVDPNILKKAKSNIHSKYEIEKALNTRFYDKNNPPPSSKIHIKLGILSDIWTIRPVKNLGIYPDADYFFHNCTNNIERILFEEKSFYPWCPGCFTKFIPSWDKETIEVYKDQITINTYIAKNNEIKDEEVLTKKRIHKSSHEYFYLSILGLNDRASPEEISNTFRKLSKIYHPDFGGNSQMFQKIVKAKNWLLKFYKYSIK